MSSDSDPKGPAPAPIHEMWSAISQGDLGLKAGYWTGKDTDPMTFRTIVGWVTALVRQPPFSDTNPPRNVFCPVVIADNMAPVLGNAILNHAGVFLKEMTEAEAKVRAREWLTPKPEHRPNVMAVGQA